MKEGRSLQILLQVNLRLVKVSLLLFFQSLFNMIIIEFIAYENNLKISFEKNSNHQRVPSVSHIQIDRSVLYSKIKGEYENNSENKTYVRSKVFYKYRTKDIIFIPILIILNQK